MVNHNDIELYLKAIKLIFLLFFIRYKKVSTTIGFRQLTHLTFFLLKSLQRSLTRKTTMEF